MKRQLSLFPDIVPNEEVVVFRAKATNDYGDFLAKFENKHTTDECYTPPEVFAVVLDYCKKNFPKIFETHPNIVRPFYPDGDYTKEDYTDAVVVDNPPFSISAKIYDFYLKNNIPFFLFCNHLTSIRYMAGLSFILTGCTVVFENGAKISTSFATNFFDCEKIVLDKDFATKIEEVQRSKRFVKKIPHHKNVLQAATLLKYNNMALTRGIDFDYCKKPYFSYRPFAKSIIISNKVAAALGRDWESNLQLSPEAEIILNRLNYE